MFRLFLITTICTFLIGCQGIAPGIIASNNKCGADIKLGEFAIEDSSKDFFSYTENDRLVFENHQGIEIIYELEDYTEKENDRDIINTLCSGGLFDHQVEYYSHDSKRIKFTNSTTGDNIVMFLRVASSNENDITDRNVFDLFSLSCSNFGHATNMYIQTAVHQAGIEEEYQPYHQPNIILDTIINSTLYPEVYSISNSFYNLKTFYTKADGLILIEEEDGKFLRKKK